MCDYIQSDGGSQPGTTALSPIHCQLCSTLIRDCFYDAKLQPSGRWGKVCPECFKEYGMGLGVGLGQRYCRKGLRQDGTSL